MKVLVVDDEIAGRKTLEIFAKKLNHDVFAAQDGQEAWEIWRHERMPLVITDWNMPKLDGIELCKKIREQEADDYTYLIIVTARDENEDVITGLEAGADDYLTKPLNRDELHVRIKTAERILSLQSKDVVIFSLAKLAESRDTDTGYHLERIRHYSRLLADDMYMQAHPPAELDRQFVNNIFLTSPLHDIGKVGIPDRILLKPGKLEFEEFEIMKTHSAIGYDTLIEAARQSNNAHYLEMAADIARHHHEKYDGSGYPDGLAGDNIPLCGRIVALADVYDALVSKRAYKAAFTHEKAKEIILEGRGAHFDPRVVESFERCEDYFMEIRENFAEPDPEEQVA